MSSQAELNYGGGQKAGVAFIALSALMSLMAIVALLIFKRPKRETFQSTHMYGYFMCLLFANVLQSIASIIMDFEWVAKGRVVEGSLCSAQGGIKQVGNLGAAIWSLIIAIHLFVVLFLRIRPTRAVFIGAIIAAWSLIVLILFIGRFGLQKADQGPYFGIAGSSCGIASGYTTERAVLDYLFSFLSIGLGLVLYILVLLRVRGILIRDKYHHWQLNIGRKENDWSRTLILQDNSINKVAQNLVWYPVSYSAILIPITVIRIVQFNGKAVPFWITVIAGIIFNLMGLVNVLLLVYIENYTSQPTLPIFSQSRVNTPNSFQSRDIKEIDIKRDVEKPSQRNSQSRRVLVKLPTKPPNTFVAPDSWKTTAPRGRTY